MILNVYRIQEYMNLHGTREIIPFVNSTALIIHVSFRFSCLTNYEPGVTTELKPPACKSYKKCIILVNRTI